MRMSLGLVMAASGFLTAGASAQTAVPPPPPPGGGWMRADTNHDGIVTRAEIIAEADARFAAMDTDKDGKVTAEERDATRKAMRTQRPGGGGGLGMRGGGPDGDGVLTREEAERRAAARFDRADTNHDGKLDAAEIAAAHPMRGPRRGGNGAPPPSAPAATPAQ